MLAQLALGSLNMALLAPVALQLIHLLLADLVWISLILTCATVLPEPAAAVAPAAGAAAPAADPAGQPAAAT